MNAENVRSLLEQLGCDRIKPTNNGWINACCPFAPYSDKHKNKQDSHPSFGVLVAEGRSGYRCFTCNAKGSLSDLVVRLHHLVTRDGSNAVGFYDLLGWIQERDQPVQETPVTLMSRLAAAEYKPRTAVEIAGIKMSERAASKVRRPTDPDAAEPIPEEAIKGLDTLPDEALSYLIQDRKLSILSVDDWELRWHAATRRIAIPIRDCQGRLVGVSGRSIDSHVRPKFLHSTGYNRDLYLYGEHKLQQGGTGTGVVVEGFFDAMHLWQHGYKAVAILGSYPSRVQIEKLVRFFGDVVVLPDGDAAGYDAAERVRDALSKRIPVRIAPMAQGVDPDNLNAEELAAALGIRRDF